MIVDEEAVDLAVLGIFSDLHAPSEGRLSLNTLIMEWPSRNLREGDLAAGIQRLVADGDLKLVYERDGTYVVLTRQGYENGPSVLKSKNLLHQFWKHIKATVWIEPPKLRHADHSAGRQRRATD